jgi:carbonic anhydrase/acetyltransferase-like protein (isoleucine patch superfamily)
MQAYILETGRRVSPFDEPVGAMPVHNRSLRDHQTSILQSLGCQVEVIDDLRQVRQKPCLLVYDDVYFTYHAVAKFLAVARHHGRKAEGADKHAKAGNFAAALSDSLLTQRFVPSFQGRTVQQANGTNCHVYDLYYLGDWDPEIPPGDQAELVTIPHHVSVRRWRVNRHFEPSGSFSLPMSTVALCPMQHWSCLLAANILGMPSHILRSASAASVRTATLPLRMLWRAGSFWPSRLRGKIYLAGRGCKVHPTAHVEWAVLGRGVRIGPNAVVRGAVLADRVEIGPGAVVEMSTLGEKASVNAGTTVRSCVVGDEGHMGSFFTQLSVVGRGAALCPASGIFDFNLRSNVTVAFEGRTVSCGSRLLGGCLGHGAFLGAEVIMASGQELPNGCVLVRSPRDIVSDLNQALPQGVVRVDRGRPRNRPSPDGSLRIQPG